MMISAIEDEEERRTAKEIYDRYAFKNEELCLFDFEE